MAAETSRKTDVTLALVGAFVIRRLVALFGLALIALLGALTVVVTAVALALAGMLMLQALIG